MAKWIRRRFPEPKIEGSSPFRDASFQRTSGLVGYDVCLTRRRSPVRSRACVFLLVPVFVFDSKCKRLSSHRQALIAQMVERKTLNLVVVGSIPTEGAFCSALLSPSFCVAGDAVAAASSVEAALAQLGERQTEDLKVPGSIPGGGTFFLRLRACPHGLMDKAHPS